MKLGQTTTDAVEDRCGFYLMSDTILRVYRRTGHEPPRGDFEALLKAVRGAELLYAFNSFIPPTLPLIGPGRDLRAGSM